MHDLAPLAESMNLQGTSWCFPQAPIDLPGFPSGKAWFPRKERELEHFSSGVSFANLREYDPPGLAESAREIRHLLSELNVPLDGLVLGGFSQGAMAAVEFLLHLDRPPKALILFSGSLIAEHRWSRSLQGKVRGLPVFQSHGQEDPVLPFEEGTRLGTVLKRAGASCRFVGFPGGHTIPSPVIGEASLFLSELYEKTRSDT